MIPREQIFRILVLATVLSVSQSQNSRSYDTSDWIPITNKCATCYQNDQQEHVIEKKATGRVLNLAEPDPNRANFFPDQPIVRNKKSNRGNVQQYLREVSPPPKRLPKRQEGLQGQPLQVRGLPPNIRLNEGEFVNQQYLQQPYQQLPPIREYQKQPQQIQITNTQPLLQQTPQLISPQLVPQAQQYFPGQDLIPQPLFPLDQRLNLYQPNYQNLPLPPQPQTIPILNKPRQQYEALNPGIQAINQGLSEDNNKNLKDYRQISITSTSPKPEAEKETVQLLYVPIESLNQRQIQIQKQQEAILQQQAEFQQEQLKAQEEQRVKAEQEQQLKAQREQELKAQQELELKAQQELELKAQQEQELKAQQLKAQREQELKALQEQRLRAQEEGALRQQQLLQQQAAALQQEQQQQAQNQQVVILQQEQPLQQVHLLPDPQRRRRPTRPTVIPQYQTRIPTIQPPEQKQQQLLSTIQNDFAMQALDALKLQVQLQQGELPEIIPQVSTTPRPKSIQPSQKKRKPHQPPLAVYMGADGEVTISDVLNVLKNAKSISVQDNVGPESPQVFVGPHNLEPPEGYAKFELPYLSALETNRVERKVDQLPFFVAPLSYKAPAGYSKIPLPAPHVGSVVVSHKDDGPEKREQPPYRLENLLNEQPYRLPNLQPYQVEPQLRPIKPFKLENAINEEPYRLPTQQTLFNPFATVLPNPATPTVPVTSRPDLLGQTINQYELEQINNQFVPQAQVQPQVVEYQPSQVENDTPNEYEEVVSTRRPHSRKSGRVTSTTPTVIPSTVQYATENPREVQTTRRVDETKSRHSARPTQRTTVSSTQSNPDKYTVLEEFSIKRRPSATTSRGSYAETATATTTTSPQTFSVEPEQLITQPQLIQHPSLPSSVSRLTPQNIPQLETHITLQYQPETQQSPQPIYTPTSQLKNQQILSQDELDKQLLQQQGQLANVPSGPSSVQTFYQIDSSGRYVPIQNVEGDPYRLVNQQSFQHDLQAFRQAGLVSSTTPEAPKEIITTTTVKLTEKPVEQTTRVSSRSNSRSRTRGRTHYVPEQYRESSEEKDEVTENYKLPAELPSINPSLHGLINDLQDQALRPLLVPSSIAPTTEQVVRSQSTTPQQQRHHSVYLEQQPQLQRQPQQQYILEQPQQPQQQYILEQPQQQYILQEQQPQNQLLLQQQQQQPQQQIFLQQQPPQQQLILQQQEEEPVKIQQQQLVLVSSTEPEPEPATTTQAALPLSFEITTPPAVITTTPNRRQRGRQRARGSTTTTSTPRRGTAQRTRKPTSRSRTEQSRYQQELIDEYGDYLPIKSVEAHTKETVSRHEVDYDTETSRKPSSRQRFRTRGRPIQELTERTSISNSAEENNFKQPALQSGFQGSHLIQPQSYMQFEQPFATVQVNQPSRVESYSGRDQIVKQYQPVYSVEQQQLVSTEPLPLSTKQVAPVDSPKLSVDVLINHPITETASKEPVLISQPEADSPYVRFNSNIQSSGRLQHNEEIEATTKSSAARTRGRGRGRSRTKASTQRPATTTINHIRTTTTEESQDEEFYGFVRPPNFNRPSLVAYRPKAASEEPKLYSATYLSTTGQPNRVHYEDQPVENSNTVQIYSDNAVPPTPRVQFVGKLRPKYSPHPVRTEEPVEVTTETVTTERKYTVRTTKAPTYSAKTTKARIRPRLRVPTRKPQTETPRPPAKKTNVHTAAPAREPLRFKQRGVNHFQLPETLKGKSSEDEDVEGGNYPVPFLQGQETQTEETKFQINLEPELDDNLSIEDQLPYSSIYSPKIVRKNIGDKEEVKNPEIVLSQPIQNDIPIQRKIVESQEQISALPIVSTTEAIKTDEKNDTEAEKTILEKILGDVEDTIEEDEDSLNNPSNYKDYLDLEEQNSSSTSTTTNKPKTRRRGAWKLVKRPVDAFETAESQYVGTVFSNSFATDENKKGKDKIESNKGEVDSEKTVVFATLPDNNKKDEPVTVESETITESSSPQIELSSQLPELTSLTSQESFLDSLYKIFGMADNIKPKQESDDKLPTNSTEDIAEHVEVTPKSETLSDIPVKSPEAEKPKIFLDEPIQISLINSLVEKQADPENQSEEQKNVTEAPILQTELSVSPQLPTQITQNLDPQADVWDFGLIKTSTSTEVSHETEICYRGRCIKSRGTKIPKL